MSPPPENPLTGSPVSCSTGEFTPEERRILLQLGHASIESALENRDIALDPPSSHLAEPRGAFTTIYFHGELRGCVGYVFPVASLYRTVAETARAAAFEDTRFSPVTCEEAPELELSLSILSPLQPITPEEVEIGKHGLLVNLHGRRGLLLPQVPVEHGWDREKFLEQTCRKAGLPADAWQKGATIEGFTAEVFGDADWT
ncbi:MAG: AmmeMemoRadiSam system protein A [Acidobacteriia bacterium]|nr:AmmeMemoRadiSam system protein A [Terriglobia bacterium]